MTLDQGSFEGEDWEAYSTLSVGSDHITSSETMLKVDCLDVDPISPDRLLPKCWPERGRRERAG
jgi:hypothetical protein